MNFHSKPQIIPSKLGRFLLLPNNKVCVSASTIAGLALPTPPPLLDWKIKQSGGDPIKFHQIKAWQAMVGTIIHELAEKFLLGEVIDLSSNNIEDYCTTDGVTFPGDAVTQIRNGFRSFMECWNHHSPELISTEQALWCEDLDENGKLILPFAGTADLIVRHEGELCLWDIKSSRAVVGNLQYLCQLNIYRMLYNRTHDEPITKIGILWAKKDYKRPNPPQSVYKIYNYDIDEEFVFDCYKMFRRLYSPSDLGIDKPKINQPTTFERSV